MLKNYQLRFNVGVLLVVAVAYILIRGVWNPSEGFGRFYATDILFGIALPSVFYLIAFKNNEWLKWVCSLKGKLALTLSASILWEGVIPFIKTSYTADLLDVLCYFGGTLIQHLSSRLVTSLVGE